MYPRVSLLLVVLGLLQAAAAHFLLQYPTTIGYVDANQAIAPCGGFSATDRSAGVTNWPLGGNSVKVISTHNNVVWEYRAARVSNPSTWVNLTPQLSQTGLGHFCQPQIPGYASWVNQDAVLQVIQRTNHGTLYGCAAIRFISGGPATPPSSCTNGTGVSSTWL